MASIFKKVWGLASAVLHDGLNSKIDPMSALLRCCMQSVPSQHAISASLPDTTLCTCWSAHTNAVSVLNNLSARSVDSSQNQVAILKTDPTRQNNKITCNSTPLFPRNTFAFPCIKFYVSTQYPTFCITSQSFRDSHYSQSICDLPLNMQIQLYC